MLIVIQFNLLIETYPIRPSTNQETFITLVWVCNWPSWVLLLLTILSSVFLLSEIAGIYEVSPWFYLRKVLLGRACQGVICQDQPWPDERDEAAWLSGCWGGCAVGMLGVCCGHAVGMLWACWGHARGVLGACCGHAGGMLETRWGLWKGLECEWKGLWTEFQEQMNLHFRFAIFSSMEIFQHAALPDKIFRRGEEIGL